MEPTTGSVTTPDSPSDRTVGGIEKRWVDLPKYKMCVSATDKTMSNKVIHGHAFEPHLTELLSRQLKPGQTFLDLGANVGCHTLNAATIVGPTGRCIAVEMSPDNCDLIRASLDANGFTHVQLFNYAVSDVPGTLTFALGTGTSNGMVVTDKMQHALNGDWLGKPEVVEARPVDDILGETVHIDLIKMDIEGSEYRAMKGMRLLLERCRPPMAFEFFPGAIKLVSGVEPVELLTEIRSYGYRLHQVLPGGDLSPELTDAEILARFETRESEQPVNLIDLFAVPA